MRQDPQTPSAAAPGDRSNLLPSRRKTGLHLLLYLLLRLAVTVLTLPVAMVLSLALHPLWSWLERTTGIESMGREGPASWCYLTVWGLLAMAVVLPAAWRARSGRHSRPTNGA